MRGSVSILLRVMRWVGIAIATVVILFFLTVWIGSSFSRNADWAEPNPMEERTIAVLVGSNGIHTEIAMPVVTAEMDWRAVFPLSDIHASHRDYTHVAVSWGERRFFLETPTWWDMNPWVAANAMIGGEGVLHVAHYVRPAPSENYRVLHLRPGEYRTLASHIRVQLDPAESRETLPGYASHDVFYTARGTYSLGNTCNQWTSDQLASAGVKVGRWTPLPGGVMKWVPN